MIDFILAIISDSPLSIFSDKGWNITTSDGLYSFRCLLVGSANLAPSNTTDSFLSPSLALI